MTRGGVRSPAAFEWARVALLGANLAWTTLCLGGFLPGSRVVMAALTAALLAVHLADPARGTRAHPAGWLFLAFLAYAAANAAWVERFPGIFRVKGGMLDTSILTGAGLGAT